MYKIIFFFSSHLTANSSQSVLTSKMLTHYTHKTYVQGAKLVPRHHADMRKRFSLVCRIKFLY